MASEFLSGFQVGANVANDAMNRNLRMQELRSQEALRRVQERAAVERMSLLMQKFDMEIQDRANVQKATVQFEALIAPTIRTEDGTEVPNPMKMPAGSAAIQSFLKLAKDGKQATDLVAAAGLANERELRGEEIGKPRPLTPEAAASMKELERQRKTAGDVNIARKNLLEQELADAKAGKGGTAPNIQKEIEWFEKVKGVTLSKDQLTKVLEIKLGLDQKAGTAKDRGNAVLEVFKSLLPNRVTIGKNAQTDEQLLDKARTIVDAIYEEDALGGVVNPALEPDIVEEEIWVISPAGKRGRIPKSDLEKALKKGYKLFEG